MSEGKAVLVRALPSEKEESEAKPSEIPNFIFLTQSRRGHRGCIATLAAPIRMVHTSDSDVCFALSAPLRETSFIVLTSKPQATLARVDTCDQGESCE